MVQGSFGVVHLRVRSLIQCNSPHLLQGEEGGLLVALLERVGVPPLEPFVDLLEWDFLEPIESTLTWELLEFLLGLLLGLVVDRGLLGMVEVFGVGLIGALPSFLAVGRGGLACISPGG